MFELTEDWRKVENAVLVGIQDTDMTAVEAEVHLLELEQLVENIEINIIGQITAKLRKRQARFLMGTGKADEIVQFCRELGADCIIFDGTITPAQQRNWEKLSGICVIDRQEVILDIFSNRARTREARLQIQLAKAKYSLPRLTRAWTHLSRQRGGNAGQRGEGEQQIEVDRRIVAHRIKRLERDLLGVRKQRETQRKKRAKLPVPNTAIVGYTNAGKSSLLNKMTGAEVLAADKLFATLDPTTKPIQLPNKQTLLLTDTVGFIRKLPHLLVESFKATLEEAVVADFLLHVVDINSPYLYEHYETTLEVLEEIGVHTKSMLPVFNKIDLLEDRAFILQVKAKYPDAVFVSSHTGEGIDELEAKMAKILSEKLNLVELQIPHSRFELVTLLHRTCDIHEEVYEDDFIHIRASIIPSVRKDIEEFIVHIPIHDSHK